MTSRDTSLKTDQDRDRDHRTMARAISAVLSSRALSTMTFLPFTIAILASSLLNTNAFSPYSCLTRRTTSPRLTTPSALSLTADDNWNGDVAGNTEGGIIAGCSLERVGDSLTDYTLTIDGDQADLGRFSEAIYKKFLQEAKQQRFQGFRPGTIPPHIEPTYRAYAMDECARETVLEAMQQNNIRPFESTRQDLVLEDFRIPPPPVKKAKKKKSKKRKSKQTEPAVVVVVEEAKEEVAAPWLLFPTMKEAISAGWKPGQSFSFIAKNLKGQPVKDKSETDDATPLGLNF